MSRETPRYECHIFGIIFVLVLNVPARCDMPLFDPIRISAWIRWWNALTKGVSICSVTSHWVSSNSSRHRTRLPVSDRYCPLRPSLKMWIEHFVVRARNTKFRISIYQLSGSILFARSENCLPGNRSPRLMWTAILVAWGKKPKSIGFILRASLYALRNQSRVSAYS